MFSLLLSALIPALALSVMGFGIFISLRIFNLPDITTDGSYTLGGAVTAVMLSAGQNAYITLPVVLACGFAAGTITGFIHTKLRINALLAGILVMTALYSVNLVIMQRSNIPLLDVQSIFGHTKTSEILIACAAAGIVLLFCLYLLTSDYGLAMRATGNSESMIRALGSNTTVLKITGLGIANALTALSGYLMVQYQGFADINMGIGIVITGLGSVIIGENLIKLLKIQRLSAALLGVILGSVVFRLLLTLALTAGLDPNLLKLATALLVLVVVAIPAVSMKSLWRL